MGVPSPPERDPANELYDRACDVLDATRGLRSAAASARSWPAITASLGCLEAALEEVSAAVDGLRVATLRGDDRTAVHKPFNRLNRDLSAAASSCAATREAVGAFLGRAAMNAAQRMLSTPEN